MKKLIWVLLLAPLAQFVSAQVILEGKFDLSNPNHQSWDGRYLVYTYYRDVHIYDTETGILHKEVNQSLPDMSFREGLYFRRTNGKYQLRRVGESIPVLSNEFLRITNWFGNTILAWEQTAPNLEGMKATWYDFHEGIIASFSLADLYRAVGYEGTYTHDAMSIFQSKPWESFIYFFHDGLITLQNPQTLKYGYYDLSLKPAFAGKFKNADPFFEGLAAVQNDNGLWGFIDKKGQEVIPFVYTKKPWPFHSGLARVENKQGLVGFIDQKGELAIPARYAYASNFYKGKSIARKPGYPESFVILDTLGNETPFPCFCGPDNGNFITQLYAAYFPLNPIVAFVDEGFLGVSAKSRSGLYSDSFDRILPLEYAMFKDFRSGKAISVKWKVFGDYNNLEHYLLDLKTNSPLIELRSREF